MHGPRGQASTLIWSLCYQVRLRPWRVVYVVASAEMLLSARCITRLQVCASQLNSAVDMSQQAAFLKGASREGGTHRRADDRRPLVSLATPNRPLCLGKLVTIGLHLYLIPAFSTRFLLGFFLPMAESSVVHNTVTTSPKVFPFSAHSSPACTKRTW